MEPEEIIFDWQQGEVGGYFNWELSLFLVNFEWHLLPPLPHAQMKTDEKLEHISVPA